MAKKKTETKEAAESTEQSQEAQPTAVENVVETVSSTASGVVKATTNAVEGAAHALGLTKETATEGNEEKTSGRRAQKVGTVSSDKMTKTVVVIVDRQVMHPKYRRYVRRTTKFMAHDEMTAGVGDKVRIEETRPMSARKRWRVIEIIQKAAK